MSDYSKGKWIKLYEAAMVEITHSLMAGRIAETRAAIVERVQLLRNDMQGLDQKELQALDDALRGLKFLEKEELRYAAVEQRKIAQEALQKLRSIGPAVYGVKPDEPVTD